MSWSRLRSSILLQCTVIKHNKGRTVSQQTGGMSSKDVDEERGQGRYQSDKPVKARISSNPTSETDSGARGRLRIRTAESHPRLHALNRTHMVSTCTASYTPNALDPFCMEKITWYTRALKCPIRQKLKYSWSLCSGLWGFQQGRMRPGECVWGTRCERWWASVFSVTLLHWCRTALWTRTSFNNEWECRDSCKRVIPWLERKLHW